MRRKTRNHGNRVAGGVGISRRQPRKRLGLDLVDERSPDDWRRVPLRVRLGTQQSKEEGARMPPFRLSNHRRS